MAAPVVDLYAKGVGKTRHEAAPVGVIPPGTMHQDDPLLRSARDLVIEIGVVDSCQRHWSLLDQMQVHTHRLPRGGCQPFELVATCYGQDDRCVTMTAEARSIDALAPEWLEVYEDAAKRTGKLWPAEGTRERTAG